MGVEEILVLGGIRSRPARTILQNFFSKIGRRIKALLLRRINDYFGNAFSDASAAFWLAAAAAAIEEQQ